MRMMFFLILQIQKGYAGHYIDIIVLVTLELLSRS